MPSNAETAAAERLRRVAAEHAMTAPRHRELADRLTTAEDLARDKDTDADVLRAAAFETQLLYRQLARTEAWGGAVRAAGPRRARAAQTTSTPPPPAAVQIRSFSPWG